MTFAPVALQEAIGDRLINTPAVVAAVPADNILDAHTRAELFPAVQIGEGSAMRENMTLRRRHVRVLAKLDIWTRAGGTSGAKIIAGLVHDALRAPLELADGLRVLDQDVERVTFSRDPANERGHAVVVLSVLIEEPLQ